MIIAVASGKGGTGKTTIATSLALAVTQSSLVYLDCDVEAPNAHLFLRPRMAQREEVGLPIPRVDGERCSGCGVCAEVCQYHAIAMIAGKPLVFPELCHGCGSCTRQCPEGALHEILEPVGVLEGGLAKGDMRFARGVLKIGKPMAVPVIRQLKQWQPFQRGDVVIRDSPAGTSCPVVESLRGADYVLLVSEPTPFGLHDLRLAYELVRQLDLPAGVIINRNGIGDTAIDGYCQEVGLPILMRIPMERRTAAALARGIPLVDAHPEYLVRFRELHQQLRRWFEATTPQARTCC